MLDLWSAQQAISAIQHQLRALFLSPLDLEMASIGRGEATPYQAKDINTPFNAIAANGTDIYVHIRQEDYRTCARMQAIIRYSANDAKKELIVVRDEQMMVHMETQYGLLFILFRIDTREDRIVVYSMKDKIQSVDICVSQMVPRRDMVTLAVGNNFFYHFDGQTQRIRGYTVQGHLRHTCRMPEVVCRKGLVDLRSTTKDNLVIAENELDRTFYGLRFPGCDILWKFEESNIVIHSFADRILYLRKETSEMVRVNPFTGQWSHRGGNLIIFSRFMMM